MPSVEGKENVDGQIPPVSCTARGDTAVPAQNSSCGVGPRSGGRKPSRRIAALGCSSSSADSNLQPSVVRASSTSASAASAAGCPAADSAQQSHALVPTPALNSGKKPARRSNGAIKAPLRPKEATDGSASSSAASVVETRKPKRSGGSGASDRSRMSRGGTVLSAPVLVPCASSSSNGRNKTSKKRNLMTRDGARGQEGRKAPQRRGVGVGGKNNRKGGGVIKPPSHFDLSLGDGEGSDVSTPRAACSGEEAATAAAAKGPRPTAQGGKHKKHKPSSAPVRRAPSPPPVVAVATTSQPRPTAARQAAPPKQSAGSQSPRGSWHLGALFGESEDEEETRKTCLWRLSDDDEDEPDLLGEGGPPGRGVGKRRRTTGNVGIGGNASWRGKRASGGGNPRQKRAAASAAAAAAVAGGAGSGNGDGSGCGGGIRDDRPSVTAEERAIACAASPVASHPGDQKRQSRGEQQEELEAKELEALLAKFRRVDSHRLNLSR